MAFVIPTFNLVANVWHPPNFPPAAPNLVPACQLRFPGKQSTGQDSLNNAWPFLWEMLVPKLTDVRDPSNGPGASVVEIPAGSGRFYDVVMCDDVARGFTNEYRVAMIRKRGVWPTPIT